MSIQRKLQEAGKFQVSGKLDPINAGQTFVKRTDFVLSKAGQLVEADGRYTFAWTTSFSDYVSVKILALLPIVRFQWQSGPDAVYRDMIFRGGNSIRGATPVPGGFDAFMTVGFLNNINPESNGYFPTTTSVAPVGLSVSTDLTLWVPIMQLTRLPVPMVINIPTNGFASQIDVNAPDLAQLTVPATIVDFWARCSMWFELVR